MKELSIEEKAKAYDEAIERAIAWRKKYVNFTISEDGTMVQDFDNIFPELIESEGERIRKEIIAHIKWCEDGGYCAKEEMTRWIAWLEKQGEQILANSAKTCKNEQRPTWSEEDEINLRKAIWYVENPPSKVLRDAMLVEWLKNLKERVQPQPKQEWSEEDKNRFRNLIFLVEHSNEGKGTKEGFVKFINRLKSLKPQPTWKPSDVQMDALYTYIYNPQYFSSPDPRMELVESVYKDLKKLMEE